MLNRFKNRIYNPSKDNFGEYIDTLTDVFPSWAELVEVLSSRY